MRVVADRRDWSPHPSVDWVAYFDSLQPDGPEGTGPTKLAALENLLDFCNTEQQEAAVQAAIDDATIEAMETA